MSAASLRDGSLTGKVALVAGAGTGHGQAVAAEFAVAGANVVCLDGSGEAARLVVEEIAQLGGKATAVVGDMQSQSKIELLVASVWEECGAIDVLCNAAESPGDGSLIEDLSEESFDCLFRNNFKTVLFTSQAVGRRMIERGGGSIISITSGILDRPLEATGGYAVAAAAIAYFSKVFAKEAGEASVRVNVIATAPHPLASPFPAGEAFDSLANQMKLATPLSRPMALEDLGAMAVFLASDRSSYVTGQTIRLSGGWTMPW